ncbi:MAG: DUF4126 domain-containing protein [Phycisphaeraceae bacterium]|nr:DUF4126 domain-containing protein [Phycisphaeraceae bacterium]
MDALLALLIGLGLAAACGFRIFVPLLVMALAARAGHLTLDPSFAWAASDTAIAALAAATLLEIGGYYVPWIDNLLDTVATPAAIVAGTIATAAMVTHMDPLMQWATAIIAGGTVAGSVQLATVVTRGASSVTTAGMANPIVSTLEAIGSVLLAILAVLVPVLACVLVIAIIGTSIWQIRRILLRRRAANVDTPPVTPPAA